MESRSGVKDVTKGDLLDEFEITTEGHGPYVLNVLSAKTYYSGTTEYGLWANMHPPGKPASNESPLNDKWFEAYPYDYLFQIPPPTIEVQGQKGYSFKREQRTYLLRESMEPSVSQMKKTQALVDMFFTNRPGYRRSESTPVRP